MLEPLKVGRYTIANRFIMAPLTRCRADAEHVPTEMMVKHYADRASLGLIICEATQVQEGYSTFAREPGIFGPKQIAGWKKVTDAVHAKGGIIFCQIHHGGRSTIKENLSHGLTEVISASAVGVTNHRCLGLFTPSGTGEPISYPQPKEATLQEVRQLEDIYLQAAKNAIEAGFDGVQIHGANGYLIDNFLKTSSNKRTDEYGGSMENRCRFLLNIVDKVGAAIGFDRTALRISPLNTLNDQSDEDPKKLTEYICEQLNKRTPLAFLDVMRSDFFSDATGADQWARPVYKGTMITGMRFTPEEAEEAVKAKKTDAVCFGLLALANPDLVERAKKGHALNQPDMNTLYTRGPEGYNTYPTM